MNQKVSIVLTSYNQPKKLERALQSLLNQTYRNIEIIIVDDCSTDHISKPFIEKMWQLYPKRIKYFFQRSNVGIPKNKNTGFKLATGEFITYLDGDDEYLPTKIYNEIEVFKSNPKIDVVFSDFLFRRDKSQDIKWKDLGFSRTFKDYFTRILSRDFPFNTVYRFELMRSSVLKAINYYDETISAFHDWDSRIRYSKQFEIGYNPNIESIYYDDPNGISKRTNSVILLNQMKYVVEKNKYLINSAEENHALRVVMRKIFDQLWNVNTIHDNLLLIFNKHYSWFVLEKILKAKKIRIKK